MPAGMVFLLDRRQPRCLFIKKATSCWLVAVAENLPAAHRKTLLRSLILRKCPTHRVHRRHKCLMMPNISKIHCVLLYRGIRICQQDICRDFHGENCGGEPGTLCHEREGRGFGRFAVAAGLRGTGQNGDGDLTGAPTPAFVSTPSARPALMFKSQTDFADKSSYFVFDSMIIC